MAKIITRAELEARLRANYSNVSVYAGGKQDWFEAGLPVERPSDVVAIC